MSGSGGICSNRAEALTLFGAFSAQSTYRVSTSDACSQGQTIIPATSSSTGYSAISIATTTPSPPPPPRTAQNRSVFCVRSARTSAPSAVTSSTASTLSDERPCMRAIQPMPPPSEYPTTPTFGEEPCNAARPCAPASSTTSSHRTPASTRARRCSASTSTPRIFRMLSRSVPSSEPWTVTPWPVPWTTIRRSRSIAYSTADTTSSTEVASTTTAGRRSAARFHDWRASS